jgi:hypothetical protein
MATKKQATVSKPFESKDRMVFPPKLNFARFKPSSILFRIAQIGEPGAINALDGSLGFRLFRSCSFRTAPAAPDKNKAAL